ncbi:MAG: hypothetical protein FH748_14955 [Balneolaceae bacterium]|nr:hypothetical protein [Balneolaceae bacterium]
MTEAFARYPVYMGVISFTALIVLLQLGGIIMMENSQRARSIILGCGLFSLFVGLLVFPVEAFELLSIMDEYDGEGFAITGGFFLTFIPMIYGLFWMLVSTTIWGIYKRKR